MHRFLKNIASSVQRHFGRPLPRPRDRRIRPRIEALEDRQLPAVVTDMTALAALFPPKPVQTLYLNFDGGNTGYFNLQAFQATTGNPVHRDRDIHDILFRTSETFAPFNVRLMRVLSGYATDSGTTTVFIGDRGVGTTAAAATPPDFVDYPGALRGDDHVPNSDPYDLAWLDPIRTNGTSWDALQISQVVAHEAGHTFGLAHIRTVGTDPSALGSGSNPDMMSYDSPNQRFVNETFNVTAWNFTNGAFMFQPILLPSWDGSAITTQNSYTYLQTRLGSRGMDDHANVIHADAVDSSYVDKAKTNLAVGSNYYGNIHWGDFDVFHFTPATTRTLVVSASTPAVLFAAPGTGDPDPDPTPKPPPPPKLDPVLLVYNDTGSLVAFNNDRTATDTNSRLTFTFEAGKTYSVVVGGANSASTSAYQLRLDAALIFPIKTVTTSFMTASPGSMVAPAPASTPKGAASFDLGAMYPHAPGQTPLGALSPGSRAAVESIRPGAALAVETGSIRPGATLRPASGVAPRSVGNASIRPGTAALDAAWRDGWQPLQPANLVLIL
jgi:hypothetical protein